MPTNKWLVGIASEPDQSRPLLRPACLVSSHVCLQSPVRYIRSFTSHELFPAPGGGGRRVSACASCRDLSVADFGLLILTLTRPSRVFMRQFGHHRVLVRRWTELVEDK